jgi:hypothetical protein
MGRVWLLEECRSSESPDHAAISQVEELRHKAVLVAEEAARAGVLSPALAMVACRDPTDDLDDFVRAFQKEPKKSDAKATELWEQYEKLKMPVFAFDRAALKYHYGPTFQSLGRFLFEYSTRNHGQGSAK